MKKILLTQQVFIDKYIINGWIIILKKKQTKRTCLRKGRSNFSHINLELFGSYLMLKVLDASVLRQPV